MVTGEKARNWKKVVAYLKVLSRYSLKGLRKTANHLIQDITTLTSMTVMT
jgi:hypothetical protein